MKILPGYSQICNYGGANTRSVFQSKCNVAVPLPKISSKVRSEAVAAMFLLSAAGGIISSCSSDSDKKDLNGQEDLAAYYLDTTDADQYVVQSGDNPSKIAQNHNISAIRLLKSNNLQYGDIIYPNDTLIIPKAYKVKNIKTAEDIAAFTGFHEDFLEDMILLEGVRDSIYRDMNGYYTIGIGHLVQPFEKEMYGKQKLTEEEIYALFARDLFERILNLEAICGKKTFDAMPVYIKEALADYIFNRGEGALMNNQELLQALQDKDYTKLISNMTQDYSYIKDTKGKKIKKYASGLSKRRLFEMGSASKIYGDEIPEEVLRAAENIYKNGLKYMAEEARNGQIPANAYKNVESEYKKLVHGWFNGKIGEAGIKGKK